MSESAAWAAGFLDADGSFSCGRARYLSVHFGQVDREPLDRFRRALGVGNVTGPYPAQQGSFGKSMQFQYQAYGLTKYMAIADALWPHLGPVKRAQATDAFRDAGIGWDPPPAREPTRREVLAWAAGFFVGEGCFSFTASNGSPSASAPQNDRDVLDRFRDATGLGKVYGPYAQRRIRGGGRTSRFQYRLSGYERVQAMLAMLWPWLTAAKRAQGLHALARAREVAYQSVCCRGHPKPPGRSGCPACVREHWRMYREGTLFEPTVPYLATSR